MGSASPWTQRSIRSPTSSSPSPPWRVQRSGSASTSGRSTSICTDRKSTRLNSSHSQISYAVFCLKKKKKTHTPVAVVSSTIILYYLLRRAVRPAVRDTIHHNNVINIRSRKTCSRQALHDRPALHSSLHWYLCFEYVQIRCHGSAMMTATC